MTPYPKTGSGYRVLVNRVGYDLVEFQVMESIATEAGAKVEDVARALEVYDAPEKLLVKAHGMREDVAQRIFAVIKARDTAAKAARVPAPKATTPRPVARPAMPSPTIAAQAPQNRQHARHAPVAPFAKNFLPGLGDKNVVSYSKNYLAKHAARR